MFGTLLATLVCAVSTASAAAAPAAPAPACVAAAADAAQATALGASDQVRLCHGLVRYELTGPAGCGGRPHVVLVAGYAVPMVVWDRTREALVEAGACVLRFDFYGRGRSARPRLDYTPELFADQLWDLLSTLGIPARSPRVHMVASSMGGAVAAVFANRHPGALDRIVLVSPAGLSVAFPPVTTLLKTPGLGPWYFDRRFRGIMLGHLQDNLHRNVHAYPAVLADFHRQLEVPGTAEAMFSTLRHTVLRDLSEQFRGLGALRRPTRVIWGAQDRLVPLEKSRKALERAIPQLELWTVPGAAHLPQLERPRLFNDLVTPFLTAP